MSKLIVKSSKFVIVVNELDTADYLDRAALFRDLSRAIPEADWWEERHDGVNFPGTRNPSVKSRKARFA